ncbi:MULTISPECIES: Crp/Fnr family transcriptional regulator [Arenibacter]|uniref:Cyclic nucleotide-binding protein n=1 Tax=Arenibacter certesii TaxID=228955 RepID=A0A918INT3_9FLAO|nr:MULTISPECIES: Crp/Fnr family transcriptional regulator [Arenibacter]MDX1363383.1 Crp/Fnr family transcriptional regulator [Arenibacter latericius]GGW24507.1 cyclic nucleotide-binding protein [Arenibacter certesii]
MKLKDYLLSVEDFPEEELDQILSSFKQQVLKKNTIVAKAGLVCNTLYYMEKGLARSYYNNAEGKDITAWFFNEGNFMTSMESFFHKKNSAYHLELLEDSLLYAISKDDLDQLFLNFPLMERFGRKLVIKLLGDMMGKLNAIQFQTAKERYLFMINEYPDLYYRVPLGHIASYLGITQETLSRIRAKN